MTTTLNATPGSIDTDLDATVICDLLAEPRRRLALHYLTQKVSAVHIGDLAEQIALWEDNLTSDHFDRICTSLVHSHLPKLAAAGAISYDEANETVALCDAAASISPYLELAAADDFQ